MSNPAEMLMMALTGDGDFDACIEAVATGFSSFCKDESIFHFPDEILAGILIHPKITFPDADEIVKFYTTLFERGPKTARLFFDSIPFDELTLQAVTKLKELYQNMNLRRETRILNSFVTMYQALEGSRTELEQTQEQLQKAYEDLQKSTDLINRMTVMLQHSTDALNDAAGELNKQKK